MIKVFNKKEECCGCGGCEKLCPTKAIKMEEDSEGFLYPNINTSECIDCGKCRAGCAMIDKTVNNFDTKIYGVKHKDKYIQETSQSGGAFSAIANIFINCGGVVYGAAFNSQLKVVHIRTENVLQLQALKGSKYVQSDLENSYILAKKDLEANLKVLFSGTSCQIGGLKKFLGKEYTNLCTVDLVCHGVPSPKLYKDYIKSLGKIDNFNFRDNQMPLGLCTESYTVDNKKKYSRKYVRLFDSRFAHRPCCYSCKYTTFAKPADFTIADFWGVEEFYKDFYSEKGVSIMLINSKKAEELFEKIKEEVDWIETTKEIVSRKNPQLYMPAKRPEKRDDFWRLYDKKGFEPTYKKYCKKKSFFIRAIKKALRICKIIKPN